MPRVTLGKTFKVNIVEYERGWGSKIDETIFYDNEVEARQFVKDYNAEWNTEKEVPDWYMIAKYEGEV